MHHRLRKNQHRTQVIHPRREQIWKTISDNGRFQFQIKSHKKIQLYFDPNNGVYYTKEIESGKAKTDSLVVVITKRKGNVYAVEYANLITDNYEISDKESVIWRCPGYDNVTCKGFVNLEKLASTFEQHRSTPSAKLKKEEAKTLSNEEKTTFYDWSKQYVKMSVVNSESLVFLIAAD